MLFIQNVSESVDYSYSLINSMKILYILYKQTLPSQQLGFVVLLFIILIIFAIIITNSF